MITILRVNTRQKKSRPGNLALLVLYYRKSLLKKTKYHVFNKDLLFVAKFPFFYILNSFSIISTGIGSLSKPYF